MRIFLPLLAIGCGRDINLDNQGDEGLSDEGLEDIGDGGEDEDTTPTTDGTIRGTVSVSLYELNLDGNAEEVSWEDANGGVFPYGNIFIGAYSSLEGEATYHDTAAIIGPSTDGDTYELTIEDPTSVHDLYVYAVLDLGADGILGTTEPQAVWPEALALEQGEELEDIDLIITTAWTGGSGGGGGGGGGGDGEGGGGEGEDTTITVSGDAGISSGYTGERCFAMLYDSAGGGPWYYDSFYPTSNGDGSADGDWSMSVSMNFGAGEMLGACDSNHNAMVDPSDTWGTLAEDGVEQNPITLAEEDVEDLHLDIPFTGVAPVFTAFVFVDGIVSSTDDFSNLPAGSTLYIAAMHTPRTGDIDVADFELAYDYMTYTDADLTGTTLPYSLIVPPWKTIYLWAYVDSDGDGYVNEVGEPLGSSGAYGRMVITDTNVTGTNISVVTYDGG